MSKQLKIYTIEDKSEEKSLREKSVTVEKEEFKKTAFKEFLRNLLFTALHSEEQDNVPASGIAAPQTGRNIRVFYIFNYDTNKWQLFINPTVEPENYTKTLNTEGCLSVPGKEGEVSRYRKIRVRYQDRNGKWKTERFKDLNAITIQHEFDHLEGILFIDRMEGVE